MANKKISELPELTTPANDDVLAIVDSSTNSTKKISVGNLIPADSVTSVNGQTGVVVLTKSDIGLGNVDNTSDVNKPISTATQTALDAKEATANKSTDVVTDQASNTKYPSVKAVYDWVVGLLTGKQDTLVSGTNIKTINSTSLLGSGDIAIVSNPGGSDTQIQYNSSGSFAGSANLTFDGTTLDANKLNVQERVTIEADSTATTQSVAVIESTSTNAGLVLQPNGTGAIMAQVPDGTATGGNARGQYAVDLQMSRTNATDVSASDYSSILGGKDNEMNSGSHYAVIVGGLNNRLTNSAALYTVISGGKDNVIGDAAYGVIGGGISNIVGSGRSVVSGGQSNTASTNTHATVVGGYQNTSSGQYSISGGYLNVASGESNVALGRGNTTNEKRSTAIGVNNTATGEASVALGSSNIASALQSATLGGFSNTASGNQSTAVGGQYNTSSGQYSVSGGYSNVASGQGAVALGYDNTASVTGGVALGYQAVANQTNSVALGYQVTSIIADGTTVKNFAISNYASLDFADDAAAATGGIPLGGVYHTSGALKIRIS